jgi:hypothetical protein
MKRRIRKKQLHREQKKIKKYFRDLGLGPEIIDKRGLVYGLSFSNTCLQFRNLPGLVMHWIGPLEDPEVLVAGLRWYEEPGNGKIVWRTGKDQEVLGMTGDLVAWRDNPELFWQDMARIYQKTPAQIESDRLREKELFSTKGLGNEAYMKAHDLIEETKTWIVEYVRQIDLGWGFYPAVLVVARDTPQEIIDRYENNYIKWMYDEESE